MATKTLFKVLALFLYLRFIQNALSIFNRSHFCLECVVQFFFTQRFETFWSFLYITWLQAIGKSELFLSTWKEIKYGWNETYFLYSHIFVCCCILHKYNSSVEIIFFRGELEIIAICERKNGDRLVANHEPSDKI